jgi:hypothetical protein
MIEVIIIILNPLFLRLHKLSHPIISRSIIKEFFHLSFVFRIIFLFINHLLFHQILINFSYSMFMAPNDDRCLDNGTEEDILHLMLV